MWARLHRVLLDRLGAADAIDRGRCSVDGASVPAIGGTLTGPNPTDCGKPGSRRHALVDANGVPLAVALTPANVHDRAMLEPALHAVPPIRQSAGRPRKRPAKPHADKGYDYRRACRRRGITPRIARRRIGGGEHLGRHRWMVERTLVWLARFGRLAARHERRADTFEAFHLLAAALICLRFAERWLC